jgi:outer membrane receptor for ferric coprogen and ferric-rhodotorulic acid
VAGTADDILTVTGETLAQVQARVLGTATSAPMFTSVHGYTTASVRAGVRLGKRHEMMVELENLTDQNYRGIARGPRRSRPGPVRVLQHEVLTRSSVKASDSAKCESDPFTRRLV